jgi:hypothetical protein
MRRFPLLAASVVAALFAGSAPADAAGPRSTPSAPTASPAAATTLQLGSLSKPQLKAKIATAKIPPMTPLAEPLEGDEIPEMEGDKTTNGFKLEYRGIKASAYDDHDSTDEVAVWIAVVRATATGYTKTVHRVDTPSVLSAKHPGTVDGAVRLFDGDRTPMLLVSAAIEDDSGSAVQAMAELDVLLEQAIAAATVMREADDDPLDVLHGTIELGRIMLGADPGRPGLGIRKIRTTDWDMLWDINPTIDGGRAAPAPGAHATKTPTQPRFVYKLSIPANVGNGRYAMRFDVPAAAGRKPRRVVKIDLDPLLVVTSSNDLDAGSDKDYFVRVCIAQSGFAGLNIDQPATPSCITKKLSWAHSAISWEEVKVYRRMRQGAAKITVFSWWKYKSGSEFKFLDLDVGKLGFVKREVNVGASAGVVDYELTGDGEGGGSWSSQCYSCGFPSGSAIGKLRMRVGY